MTAFGPTLPIGILFASAFLHPAYLRRNLWFCDWLASGGHFRLNGHVTSLIPFKDSRRNSEEEGGRKRNLFILLLTYAIYWVRWQKKNIIY